MPYQLPHSDAQPPKLDQSRVPRNLHAAIPLAEKYGVCDDSYRLLLFETLDREDLNLLVKFKLEYEDALEQWLTGPEADEPLSEEYVTFTALLMIADMV